MRIAQRARAEGKCVVIGLQSTGEARLAEAIADAGEEGLEDFRGLLAIIESLVRVRVRVRVTLTLTLTLAQP